MSIFLLTLGLAFLVVTIALALMGISWLITGKLKIRPGACGQDPTKKRDHDQSCGTEINCYLCKKPEKKEKNLGNNDCLPKK